MLQQLSKDLQHSHMFQDQVAVVAVFHTVAAVSFMAGTCCYVTMCALSGR